MNYAYTIPSSIRKTAALLAIITLAATSMPLVAYAESTGVTIDKASATTEVGEKVNFVVSTTYNSTTTPGTYIAVTDNGAGGSFYNGTEGGACNTDTPDGDNEFAIDQNKGVCYSNNATGTHSISVQLFDASDAVIGSPATIDITVDAPAVPQITNVDAYYTVGAGYTAISVDFTTENITDANNVELRVNRSDSSTYSITAQQSVIDLINANSPQTLTGPIVITGSRTSSSWNNQTGTWSGSALPVSVEVIITLAGGGTLTLTDTTISESLATRAEVLPAPTCDTNDTVANTTFDTFALGSVNGQNGWSATGPYDQEVVENTYGFSSFGCKSLRVSDAVTSGSFGDWVISAPTATASGESTVAPNSRFEMEFDIASTMSTEQSDLQVSVAPHDGNGSRMSYLGFADQADGIHVTFFDVANSGPLPTASTFNSTDIATLDRSVPHTVKLVMDFVDGPGNDVVEVYINDVLAHTGTSWENYYRYDAEQSGNGNTLFPVDSMIIQARGTAHPANDGNGYLFDNISLNTGTTPPPAPKDTETIVVTGNTSAGENQPGWLFNRDTSTATPFEFNEDEASIGDGALYVLPIGSSTPADKFIAEYFALAEMGDVDSFSYDFNIGQNATTSDANEFYLSVYANFATSSPTKFYDCRYNVVPTTGVVGGWTTVTFDPSQTYSYTQHGSSPAACPGSPAAMGADAVIRAFAINVGDTSADDAGVDGYIDNVVFETDTKVTTFDFEMESTDDDDDDDDNRGSSASGGRAGGTSGPTPQVLGASTDQEMLDLLNAIEARLYELLAERNAATPTWTPTVSGASTSTGGPAAGSGDEEVVEEDEEDATSTPVTIPDDEEDEDEAEDGETEIPWAWIAWGLVALWLLASGAAYWHLRQNPGSTYMRIVQGVFGVIGLGLLISFFLFGLAGVLFWPSLILAVGAITAYFWTLE